MIAHLLLIGILLSPVSSAQRADADTCRDRVNREIAREHRLYRAHLFGKVKPEDAPLGDVRFDHFSTAWRKMEEDKWEPEVLTGSTTELNNEEMFLQDEHRAKLPIKSLFAQRRTESSDLIAPALMSMRALNCRMGRICTTSILSFSVGTGGSIPIENLVVPGCETVDGQSYPECHAAAAKEDYLTADDIQTYCNGLSVQTLKHEEDVLKMVFVRDAEYRSLLQLLGNIDALTQTLGTSVKATLRQTVSLLGKLHQIPCFISSCDAEPTE